MAYSLVLLTGIDAQAKDRWPHKPPEMRKKRFWLQGLIRVSGFRVYGSIEFRGLGA